MTYNSIDFEETPILKFEHFPGRGLYRVLSVWSLCQVREVSHEEFVDCVDDYIASLKERLLAKEGIDLARSLAEDFDCD